MELARGFLDALQAKCVESPKPAIDELFKKLAVSKNIQAVLRTEQEAVKNSKNRSAAIQAVVERWGLPAKIFEQDRRWVRGVAVPLKFARGFLDVLKAEYVTAPKSAIDKFFEELDVPEHVRVVLKPEHDAVRASMNKNSAVQALVSRWGLIRWLRAVAIPLRVVRGFHDALKAEYVERSKSAVDNFFKRLDVPEHIKVVLKPEQVVVQGSADKKVAIQALAKRMALFPQTGRVEQQWVRATAVPQEFIHGFVDALKAEYVQTKKSAIDEFFKNLAVPEHVMVVLRPEHDVVRGSSHKGDAVQALEKRMGLGRHWVSSTAVPVETASAFLATLKVEYADLHFLKSLAISKNVKAVLKPEHDAVRNSTDRSRALKELAERWELGLVGPMPTSEPESTTSRVAKEGWIHKKGMGWLNYFSWKYAVLQEDGKFVWYSKKTKPADRNTRTAREALSLKSPTCRLKFEKGNKDPAGFVSIDSKTGKVDARWLPASPDTARAWLEAIEEQSK